MVDYSIYDNIFINTFACVVFSIVGLSIVSALLLFIFFLFLTISYFYGVLFISVHLGEFVLVDETLMNTLFWGSLGTTRAVHFAYTVSSIILVVIFKYYIYEPDTEKQG